MIDIATGTKATRRGEQAKPARTRRKRMPVRERNRFKKMLLEMREALDGRLLGLQTHALKQHEETNIEEDGSDLYDRELTLQLASSRHGSLAQIDNALRRIQAGTYGTCEECSQPIPEPRLHALPFVMFCIDCQSKLEGDGPRLRPQIMAPSG